MSNPVALAVGRLREPVNGLTHLGGALLSIVGIVLLVGVAAERGTAWHVWSFAIFGASLLLMYATSALYHSLPLSEAGVRALKRVDHMAIFVLIAGTYTPFCLGPLRDGIGWPLLAGVWAIAALGVLFKIFWIHAPRWLSTGVYLAMGWLSVVAIGPLIQALPTAGVVWMAVGGALYSVGALVYAFKWPNPWPRRLGFHEIWHLFVIAGSFCHFWTVYRHVVAA
ncbi:MAG: hemolysin III family protein [Candidatus Methylomirabilis sp.]|nr:hemolysin III family protein [Deltaproteobacteria bacterium]